MNELKIEYKYLLFFLFDSATPIISGPNLKKIKIFIFLEHCNFSYRKNLLK